MPHKLIGLLIAFVAANSLSASAAGVPKTCKLKSQEIKLARECFSGDMRGGDDFGTFIGTDETSKEDLNYCYNAFVILHPKHGAELQMTVLKDNEKGQLKIFNYAVMEQAMRPPKGSPRSPASKAPAAVTFKNLTAECFAHNSGSDKCSKGVFGFGNTDLPMTVEVVKAKTGYVVKGSTRDAAAIQDAAATRALEPKTEGDAAQTGQWLMQVVKQRLLSTAQRKLAMINAHKLSTKNLGDATTQFRYCRMALDGFVHQRKLPDPFTDKERHTLDSLEDHLKSTAPAVKR